MGRAVGREAAEAEEEAEEVVEEEEVVEKAAEARAFQCGKRVRGQTR